MHHARHSLILHLGAVALAAGSIFAAPAAMAGGVCVNPGACARPCRQFVAAQQTQAFNQSHRALQRAQQIGSTARRHAGVIEPVNTIEVADDVQADDVDVVIVVHSRSHGRHCR